MSLFEKVGRVIPNAPQGSVRVKMSATPNRRVRDNAPYLPILHLLAFVLALISPRALRAETTVNLPSLPGSGVTVRLATPLTQLPHFGFLPVRVFVENLTARDGTWDLNFQVGSRGFASAMLSSVHTVAVPAGQTRETWLYVPVAQAGFTINAGAPGGGSAPTRVSIAKTPKGTKVTRTTGSGGGALLITMVTEIDETTGEMTTESKSGAGHVLTNTTARPPPGNDVTFMIDTRNGVVIPRYRLAAVPGRIKVTVVNSSSPSGPAAAANVATLSRVQVAQARIGTTGEPPVTPTPTTRTNVTIPATGSTAAPVPKFGADTGTPAIGVGSGLIAGNRSSTISPPSPGTSSSFSFISGPVAATGNAAATPVTVEITGPGFAVAGRAALPNNSGGNTMRPFAVSVPLEAALRGMIAPEVRGAPNLASVTVAQLPADWRVWSSFAGVVLSADEFSTLDASHRGALLGWVGTGGQLYLAPAAAGEAHEERVGAGRIVTLAAPIADTPAAALRDALQIYSETPALPDRETLFLKKTALGEEIAAEGSDSSWVAIFLVVFAAVIGPLNLFVFAPRAKRHRLFWTTPALALLGGVALVATIFFQDGTGGVGRRSTVVVLLPGQNQAAVFQEQAARTGFLFKRTFALDDDVILAPLALEAENNFRLPFDSSGVTRAAGQGGGEWFPSRSRPAHLLRRLAPTRGRVELVGTAADGAPIVESSLATVLNGFVLRDEAGKFWSVPKLAPGARVTLAALTSASWSFSSTDLGGSRGLGLAFEAATKRAAGCWTARGGETEVGPVATLASLRWGENPVAYVGVAEARAAASAKGGLP